MPGSQRYVTAMAVDETDNKDEGDLANLLLYIEQLPYLTQKGVFVGDMSSFLSGQVMAKVCEQHFW